MTRQPFCTECGKILRMGFVRHEKGREVCGKCQQKLWKERAERKLEQGLLEKEREDEEEYHCDCETCNPDSYY